MFSPLRRKCRSAHFKASVLEQDSGVSATGCSLAGVGKLLEMFAFCASWRRVRQKKFQGPGRIRAGNAHFGN